MLGVIVVLALVLDTVFALGSALALAMLFSVVVVVDDVVVVVVVVVVVAGIVVVLLVVVVVGSLTC